MTAKAATHVPVDALGETRRVEVRFRSGICSCGCHGSDYQHKTFMDRTLRSIQTHTPRTLRNPNYAALAEAIAVAPWGEQVKVWAVAYAHALSGPRFAQWEIASLHTD